MKTARMALAAILCTAALSHAEVMDTGQGVFGGTMTVQGQDADGFSLKISSGIRLSVGGIKWADGTTSTTASSGGAGGHTISTSSPAGGLSDFSAETKLIFDGGYFVLKDSSNINGTLVRLADRVSSMGQGSANVGSQCVVLHDGSVQCSGYNATGELGIGSTANQNLPRTVALSSPAVSVVQGGRTVCALMKDSSVYCWGYNGNGECGDGTTTTPRTIPVKAQGLTNVVKLVASGGSYYGNHFCALDSGDDLWCWGYNNYGQLGTNDTTARDEPTKVVDDHVHDVVAGGNTYGYTCILLDDGTTKCTGYNAYGQVGDGTISNKDEFATVINGAGNALANVTQMAANPGLASGASHTCAVAGGGAYCWGYNGYGQLGVGDTTARSSATAVVGLGSSVSSAQAGGGNIGASSAIMSDGTLRVWGQGGGYQCGDGTTSNCTSPVSPTGAPTVQKSIMFGNSDGSAYLTRCVLSKGGEVFCWGANVSGNCGDGTTTSVQLPARVPFLSNVVDITAGGNESTAHACALTSSGKVYCWGGGGYGQIGQGKDESRSSPTQFRVY